MQTLTNQIRLMGTVITVTISHPNADKLINKTFDLLKMYERRFSANDDKSELMQINLNAGVKPMQADKELYNLIKLGKFYSLKQYGNLNIALGPLVKTWHIGFKDAKKPSQIQIDNMLKLTDPNDIILNDDVQSVFLRYPHMQIDLGSLAKGYIADLIKEYLIKNGVKFGLLNLGGNVVTIGSNYQTDTNWNIGIRNPKSTNGDILGVVKINNQSVVTSGIYERYLKTDMQTFHHIFDKHTGYPIDTNLASLTIISDKSTDGEIWTTMLFGKPLATIKKVITQLEGIWGIAITTDNQIITMR